MKWSEIALLPLSGYKVSVEWKSLEKQLALYEHNYGLELNPDYQRPLRWDKARQAAYIEYILSGGQESRTLIFNSEGWGKNYDRKIELVDGKQRLHAVRSFIRNELPAFGYFCSDFEGKIPNRVEFIFRITDLTRTEVLQLYLALNKGGVPHSDLELSRVEDLLYLELNE